MKEEQIESKDIYYAIWNIMNFRYGYDSTSVEFTIAKLLEEAGELSQASQTKVGNLRKPIKYTDHTIEEAADTMITVLDILVKTYKNEYNQEELMRKLTHYLMVKRLKWIEKEGLNPNEY